MDMNNEGGPIAHEAAGRSAAAAAAGEYLTYRLDTEDYGVVRARATRPACWRR